MALRLKNLGHFYLTAPLKILKVCYAIGVMTFTIYATTLTILTILGIIWAVHP